ncbi:MAG: hypothetical protein M1820_009945 [Bogoriella megaspora]|nr:MAG: hypothetical protein M1820_009945 [Bogoriella megaspora]
MAEESLSVCWPSADGELRQVGMACIGLTLTREPPPSPRGGGCRGGAETENGGAFPLLRLPAELRLEIYDRLIPQTLETDDLFILDRAQTADLDGVKLSLARCRNTDGFPAAASLLKTCRLLYWEILPILYGRRTFSFGYYAVSLCPLFLCRIGGMGRKSITSLHLRFGHWGSNVWDLSTLVECVNLKSLKLEFRRYMSSKKEYRRIRNSIETLLKLRNIEDVEFIVACSEAISGEDILGRKIRQHLRHGPSNESSERALLDEVMSVFPIDPELDD